MDRLHAMKVFARVIDEGSFAAAARRMNLSPAAVTRLVADLEEHLGARLITRTTRRLALTDAGESYLERTRQILSDIDEAEAQAGASAVEPKGHLRVLVPPAFAVHQIAKHLPAFRARCPQVTIELAATGQLMETIDENFDITIIIVGRRLQDGDFVARALAQSEIIICASPDYLDRRGRPQHPSELLQHDTMMPTYLRELSFAQGGWEGSEATAVEAVRLGSRRPSLSATHMDTMYAAALAGMGIAGLPSFVAEDALLEHALERVLPEWQMIVTTIYAAMPSRKHVPARTRVFMDFLVETFGSQGADRDPWLLSAGCATRPVAVPPQPGES